MIGNKFEQFEVDDLLRAIGAYIEGAESGGERAALARAIQTQIELVGKQVDLVVRGLNEEKLAGEIKSPIYSGEQIGILREATEIYAEGVNDGRDQDAIVLASHLQMIDRAGSVIVTVQRGAAI